MRRAAHRMRHGFQRPNPVALELGWLARASIYCCPCPLTAAAALYGFSVPFGRLLHAPGPRGTEAHARILPRRLFSVVSSCVSRHRASYAMLRATCSVQSHGNEPTIGPECHASPTSPLLLPPYINIKSYSILTLKNIRRFS
jgi:hypothetical protein